MQLDESPHTSDAKTRVVFVLANPNSGSRQAVKFLERYGTSVPISMTVTGDHDAVVNDVAVPAVDERLCRVTLFDVTKQKEVITRALRVALEGKLSNGSWI